MASVSEIPKPFSPQILCPNPLSHHCKINSAELISSVLQSKSCMASLPFKFFNLTFKDFPLHNPEHLCFTHSPLHSSGLQLNYRIPYYRINSMALIMLIFFPPFSTAENSPDSQTNVAPLSFKVPALLLVLLMACKLVWHFYNLYYSRDFYP